MAVALYRHLHTYIQQTTFGGNSQVSQLASMEYVTHALPVDFPVACLHAFPLKFSCSIPYSILSHPCWPHTGLDYIYSHMYTSDKCGSISKYLPRLWLGAMMIVLKCRQVHSNIGSWWLSFPYNNNGYHHYHTDMQSCRINITWPIMISWQNYNFLLGTVQKTLLGGGGFSIFTCEIWVPSERIGRIWVPPERIGRIWVPPSEDWQNLGTTLYIYVY